MYNKNNNLYKKLLHKKYLINSVNEINKGRTEFPFQRVDTPFQEIKTEIYNARYAVEKKRFQRCHNFNGI